MINLEQLFIEYARAKATKKDASAVYALYDEWKCAPAPELNGLSPLAYVDSLRDGYELVALLEAGRTEIVIEKVEKSPQCAEPLYDLITGSDDEELIGLAIELLANMNGNEPLETYIVYIKESRGTEDIRELMVERLKVHASAIKERLLEEAEGASLPLRTVFAEVLICAGQDERIFQLLKNLFLTGGDIPLYAGYLGRYGDERAAALLYPALDRANYADYIEIKNAIERLGGVVDEDMKDFTEDPLYRLLKGIQ